MITKYRDWLHVPGDLTVAPHSDRTRVFVGRGLAGYVDACIKGFAGGHDVGFIRSNAKAHGLRLCEEGSHQCAGMAGERGPEVTLIERAAVKSASFADGPERVISVDASELTPNVLEPRSVRHAMGVVRNFINVESGSFVLSGGGVSTTYVDTIPAVTSFVSLAATVELAASLLERPTLIVAPPYGAVSLGIFAGMKWQVDVAIPSHNDVATTGLVNTLNKLPGNARVLVVDDYYSTGSTVNRVLAGFRGAVQTFAVCRRAGGTRNGPRVVSLFENHDGAIEWSGDLSRERHLSALAALPAATTATLPAL